MHLFALLKGLEFDHKRNASQMNRVSQIKIILVYSELNWNIYCTEWSFQFFVVVEDNVNEFENEDLKIYFYEWISYCYSSKL